MKIVALASGSLFLVGGLIVAVFLSLQLINQSAQAASSGGPGDGLFSVGAKRRQQPSGGFHWKSGVLHRRAIQARHNGADNR